MDDLHEITPVAPRSSETEFEKPVASLAHGETTRRDFFRRAAALGIATSAIGPVLAACGGETAGTSASITVRARHDAA